MDGRSDCSVQYSLWLVSCLRGVASGTWCPPTASHDGGMMVKFDALSEGTAGSVLWAATFHWGNGHPGRTERRAGRHWSVTRLASDSVTCLRALQFAITNWAHHTQVFQRSASRVADFFKTHTHTHTHKKNNLRNPEWRTGPHEVSQFTEAIMGAVPSSVLVPTVSGVNWLTRNSGLWRQD